MESTIFLCGTKNIVMVLKIYQNANSPQGWGLYFAKYSPQPASNLPHGEFLSTVNLNFVPQRNNSTANIRIQHMYVRSGLRVAQTNCTSKGTIRGGCTFCQLDNCFPLVWIPANSISQRRSHTPSSCRRPT